MDKISNNLKAGLVTGLISLVFIILSKSLDNFHPGFFLGLLAYIGLPAISLVCLTLGLFKKYVWLFGILFIGVGVWIGSMIWHVNHICGSGAFVKPFWCSNTALAILIVAFLVGFGLIIISITKSIVTRNV